MAQQNIGTDWRVFYTRSGAVRYTSHLDVNRCMQRALARSRLPVWYTQGFNPHIYVTFALPTPLGYESLCETMDFRLLEDLPPDEICGRLNACLPQGFRVRRAALPRYDSEAICAADYSVALSAPGRSARDLRRLWDAFWDQEAVEVEKKTKKGIKLVDLKPLMDLLAMEEQDQTVLQIRLRLAAGGQQNINPTLVSQAFAAHCGVELDCIRVVKEQVYVEISPNLTIFE